MSNRRGSGVRDRDRRLEARGVNDIGARCAVPRRCCFRCSVARRRRIKIKIPETALEVSLAIEADTRYFKSDPLGNHVVQGDAPPKFNGRGARDDKERGGEVPINGYSGS